MHLPLRLVFPKMSRFSMTPPIPLASLGELEGSRQYESDASVHDRECDDWLDCNVDEE